jgi:signal transduction histidine kinase
LGHVVARTWAQNALRQHEKLLQQVLDTIPVGIWIVDSLGNIVYGNPEGHRIWAGAHYVGLEQFGVYRAWWVSTGKALEPDDWAAARLVRTGEASANEELEIQCFDGTRRYIINSALPFYSEGSNFLGGIIINQDIHDRKVAERELLEVRRRLEEARESERLYLAQELHDVPMQELYVAEFALQDLLTDASSDTTRELLYMVQSHLRQANRNLRDMCNELRPPVLVGYGLPAALEALVRDFQHRYPRLLIQLESDPEPPGLSNLVRLALYRIGQQALNNVAKHAQATTAAVHFQVQDGALRLEVRDDGRGFVMPPRLVDLAREQHFGLLGAVERAANIGGHCEIISAPGQGTVIRVIVPYHPEQEGVE